MVYISTLQYHYIEPINETEACLKWTRKKNTILQNSAAEAEGPRIPSSTKTFSRTTRLINRFFYLSPTLSGGLLICKISYEESVFLKDGDEDLCLLHTTCRTAPDTFSVRLS